MAAFGFLALGEVAESSLGGTCLLPGMISPLGAPDGHSLRREETLRPRLVVIPL